MAACGKALLYGVVSNIVVLYMLICNNAIAYSTFSVIFSFSSLLIYVLVIIGLMSLLTLLFMGFSCFSTQLV